MDYVGSGCHGQGQVEGIVLNSEGREEEEKKKARIHPFTHPFMYYQPANNRNGHTRNVRTHAFFPGRAGS